MQQHEGSHGCGPYVLTAAMTEAAHGSDPSAIRVQMAFACENVVRKPGSPVTFEHVLDGIAADDFPAPSGRWYAIFCFYSELEQTVSRCRVIITDDGGDPIAQSALRDMRFRPDDPVSRNVVRFDGLAWPHPGRYRVTFLANRDDVLAFFPLWVQHAPPMPQEAQPEA